MVQRFRLPVPTRVPRYGEDGRQVGWQDGPPEEAEFELAIDLDRIRASLAREAARNRTGRAQAMSGRIVCRKLPT